MAGSQHALIIEDEALIALELEAMLTDLGFDSFDFADTPDDALARALARRPDLITADFRIIAGTGVEAVERITAAIGEVPVVYVTGNPDLVAAHATTAVLDKPISRAALAGAWTEARTWPASTGPRRPEP